jgi:hypothetical protein
MGMRGNRSSSGDPFGWRSKALFTPRKGGLETIEEFPGFEY